MYFPKRLVPALAGLSVFLSACGSGNDGTSAETAADDRTEAAASPTDTEVAGGCASVDLSEPPAAPTQIRLGIAPGGEEPLHLMEVRPELGDYNGTWYEPTHTVTGGEDRIVAFQAGEYDIVTISAPHFIRAVSQGIPFKAVAETVREGEGGHQTTFESLEGSGIETVDDLKGARIGIADIASATEYWAKTAVASAGLDPEVDVEYVVVPLPTQEQALRTGQIDVATLTSVFQTVAYAEGGTQEVFDSRTGPGFDQPLFFMAAGDEFISESLGSLCAWLADLVTYSEWWMANEDEAKQFLLSETDLIRTPPETYMDTQDYLRAPDAEIDLDVLERLMESMVEFGTITEEQAIDVRTAVVPGVSLITED